MKKRFLSMVLAIAMMAVSMLAFPASATSSDTIFFPLSEAHGEIYIDLPDDGSATTKTVQFTVPYHGWYIIQTMGFPDATPSNDMYNGSNNGFVLRDGNNQTVPTNGVTRMGYGLGKLFNCELYAGEEYTLTLTFTGAVEARLVITHAEGLFNQPAPIGNYNQITSFTPGVIEFTFNESNHQQAQVALVERGANTQSEFGVEIDGCLFVNALLLDPRVSDDTGSTWLYSGCTVMLDLNVPYYLVVYLEQGEMPVDFPLVVTVKFTPIG